MKTVNYSNRNTENPLGRILKENKREKKTLLVDSVLESDRYCMNGVHKCWGMITVQSPMMSDINFGVDFVLVIDVSASMNVDKKLSYVQKAIDVLLVRLNSQHRLSLVVFNHNVSVLCDLIVCDEKNKDIIRDLLEGMGGSGSTNIADAIHEATKILERREDCDRISSILLITDGLSNRGLTGEETMSSLSDVNMPVGCVCNTFGVGEEHDSKTLHTIALKTQGVYYYIEKTENIPNIFNDCVSEILSTTANKITVKIRGQDGARIIALHIPFKVKELKKAKDYDIDLGRISSEETKSILFRLSLRRVSSQVLHRLVKVTVTYSDMFGRSYSTQSMVSVERSPEQHTGLIPLILDENINRYAAAKVINEAIELSNQLNFTEAREKLEKIIDVISSSPSCSSMNSQQLVSAVSKCIEGMSDIISFQTGMHSAHALSSFYFMEKNNCGIHTTHHDFEAESYCSYHN